MAAQVAVGDDPRQTAVTARHAGHAEAGGGDCLDDGHRTMRRGQPPGPHPPSASGGQRAAAVCRVVRPGGDARSPPPETPSGRAGPIASASPSASAAAVLAVGARFSGPRLGRNAAVRGADIGRVAERALDRAGERHPGVHRGGGPSRSARTSSGVSPLWGQRDDDIGRMNQRRDRRAPLRRGG